MFYVAYRNSAGFVYLRFETVEAAMAAQRAMHMRWFARRLISALFMVKYFYSHRPTMLFGSSCQYLSTFY